MRKIKLSNRAYSKLKAVEIFAVKNAIPLFLGFALLAGAAALTFGPDTEAAEAKIMQLEQRNKELETQVQQCKTVVHKDSVLLTTMERSFYLASEALFGAADRDIIRIDKATREMATLREMLVSQKEERARIVDTCRFKEGESAAAI